MSTEARRARLRDLSPAKRAALLEALRREAKPTEKPATIPRTALAEPPLSFAQQRLWFLDRLVPDSALYNVAFAARLRGRLLVAAWRASLARTILRHDILRTRFPADRPVQIVEPNLVWSLPQADFLALPRAAREAELRRVAQREAARPFDLDRAPLLRGLLVRLEREEHAQILALHHLVCDGWSDRILLRDTAELYRAAVSGTAPDLPELPIQYADYAAWQRERAAGDSFAADLAYWRERMAGAPAALDLPFDRSRPAEPSHRSDHRRAAVPQAVAGPLRALARREGVTLFTLLLAAFEILLLRWSGKSDLVVGTPVADREREEVLPLIGLMLNSLALRVDLSGDPPFRVALGRVRDAVLGAFAHRQMPFERLVDELRPERTLAYSPIFQVLFLFQEAGPKGGDAAGFEGLAIEAIELESGSSGFDLGLSLWDDGSGFSGSLAFAPDLLDPATAIRLSGSLGVLLAALADHADPADSADPAKGDLGPPISALPLLSRAERSHLLIEWNDTAVAYGGEELLHVACARSAAENPDAIAVAFEDAALSFGALDELARRLAAEISARGVAPGEVVGIFVERSLELSIGLLGVLHAGAAYLPLDPESPAERLAFMIEDAAATLVLAGAAVSFAAPAGRAVSVLVLDDAAFRRAPLPVAAGLPGGSPAYLLFTSGSTGLPKGAMIPHAGIVNRLAWMQDAYRLGPRDHVLQKTPTTFDVSLWELFWPLLTGSCLVYARPGGHRDPGYLVALIREREITTLHFVPSMLQAFLHEPGSESCPSLRRVVASGEALPPTLAARCRERIPAARLENLYGPTEASVDVTCWTCRPDEAEVPIGRPIANVRVYVADPRRPVSIGSPGELLIGGVALALGYRNRPALTAERFVPDGLSGGSGQRLYRTGDLCRLRADGRIEYQGRLDHQVKIRGFRIELGEIEGVLAGEPGVREAVVAAVGEKLGERRLVAYLVAQPGTEISIPALRERLLERLPVYMVPALFVTLEEIPRTSSGKVDRRALPEPDPEQSASRTAYAPPETEMERRFAAIWAQVLGLERIGRDDGFFALGGDSMNSLQVVARAREQHLDLSVAEMFRHPTLRQLAAAVEEAAPQAEALDRLSPLPARQRPFGLVAPEDRERLPAQVVDAYPLTLLQSGMLYHMEELPEYPLYQNVDSWHLEGRFVPGLFRQVVERVVARHPVLRTGFDLANYGEPLQLVYDRASLPIAIADLSALPAAVQAPVVEAAVERERRRPFDRTRPPLLRFHVHILSGRAFRFTLTEFHPILDGWSLQSMFVELLQHYFALLRGEPARFEPPLAQTFREYVGFEREALASAEARSYWQTALADAPILDLPSWPAGLRIESERPVLSFTHRLAGEILDGAKRLAAAEGTPLKSVFLAVHFHVLSLLCASRDVVSGLTTEGRPEGAEGDQVLGLFLNTLPLRVAVAEGSWSALVQAAFAAEQGLVPHRRYPFAAIQKERGRRPLFGVVFNLTRFHVYRNLDGALEREFGRSESMAELEESHFPLTVTFSLDPEGRNLSILFEYRPDTFAPAQMYQIGQAYIETLQRMLADPAAAREEGGLLSPAARHQTLFEWNDTARARPRLALPDLFAAQARRTPEAIAVVAEEGCLTFRELARRANSLAHRLAGLGVGPEVVVGVHLDRSLAALVAILGVLEAGGAYLPLDPETPRERLARILEDARAAIVLTRAAHAARLPETSCRSLAIDAGRPLGGRGGRRPAAGLDDRHLAYVIFTSGSTGRPKGVMMSHAAIRNRLLWMLEEHPFAGSDRVLQKTALGFDASIWEIFAPLLSGACLVLAAAREHQDASALVSRVVREQITVLQLVPSMLGLFVDEEGIEGCRSLRRLFSGGEALSADLALRATRRLGSRPVNLYGPTEAAIDASSWPVTDLDLATAAPIVPIGRPLANVGAHVVDGAGGFPLPGVPGELHVTGAGLARGYLGRPDLTALAFVPDAWSGVFGARAYATGDRVRRRPDGVLEFIGRRDEQVKIHGFRIEPAEVSAALAAHPAVAEAVVLARRREGDDLRLVAYFVVRAGAATPPGADLRRFLEERIPAYMVPRSFVPLAALPLRANGKLDRDALPDPEPPRPEVAADYRAPRTAREQILAEIWARVLRLDSVGVHDDFFALGGDSILSHQISTRARAAGLRFAPQLLFAHPTVAELAAAAEAAEPSVAPRAARPGDVPLTPIQARFLELTTVDPHHANQALLLEVSRPLAAPRLAAAVARVAGHHEALRLRFARAEGGWRQWRAGREGGSPWGRIDLSGLDEGRGRIALEHSCGALQAGFDLAAGPLFRAVLFSRGDGRTDRVLLIAHHLVIDAVSWRILLEDLELAISRLGAGLACELPAETTSYSAWAHSLVEAAASPALLAELPYWRELLATETAPLPGLDREAARIEDRVGGAATLSVGLEPDETGALLHEVPRVYRAGMHEALLAALAEALALWTGGPRVRFDLEGHGREELSPEVDVSRTVGWFTSIFPVVLDLGGARTPGERLLAVKEQLGRIPRRGAGFGVLRHLGAPNLREELAAAAPSRVLFNYLGQLDAALPEDSGFHPAPESAGPSYSLYARREYTLEIEAQVAGGRLRIGITYPGAAFRRESVAQLGAGLLVALRALVRQCRGARAEPAPADFPLAALTARDLDRLGRRFGEIEDVYPLSPLQQGLLFHALHEPGAGLYVVQFHFSLRGRLRLDLLRRAWERVLKRHGALRTAFVWDGFARPLQVVVPSAGLPWREEDWRGDEPGERQIRLARLLADDRREDFDLGAPPLLRFAVVRTEEERFEAVWTFHHLLLDGWSGPLVLRELMAAYAGLAVGAEPRFPAVRPYRDYVAWLSRQDLAEAEGYWRAELAGFSEPTRIDLGGLAKSDREPGESATRFLSPAETERLTDFARGHRLTIHTLLLGAWGFLLGRYSGRRDVVFGAVTSGRPAELPGVETMVGLFINTLPVRVRTLPETEILDWLREIQKRQLERQRFEHTPLIEVRAWSDVAAAQPLFESLLVFENYPDPLPTEVPGGSRAERIEFAAPEVSESSHYPLTLRGEPGARLGLGLLYSPDRYGKAEAERLLGFLEAALTAMPGVLRLGDLPSLAPAERRELLLEPATRPVWPLATLHGRFEGWARATPDAIALVAEDSQISYRALDALAERWACHLAEVGVGLGDRVAVYLPRSPRLAVALLATLKVGAAYLPLDVKLPAERLAAIVRDARPCLALSEPGSIGALESLRSGGDFDGPILDLDRLPALAPAVRPATEVGPDDLAYVVYTSGSTGLPKGAAIPHRSCTGYMFGVDYAEFGAGQVWLQYSSVSWDVLTLELWSALCHGARVVLYPHAEIDPDELGRSLALHGVTTAWITSSFFNVLVDLGAPGLSGLRQLLTGGEALSVGHVRRALALLPRTRLVNGYGPSECTVFCACLPIPRELPAELRALSIGRPIGDRRIYLLDGFGEPVPWGVVGELCVGGPAVALGYLARPALTAERFVPDAFGGGAGDRLYRTGDLARFLADGTLEFLGRFDRQVKVRGFRIELEEIEATLSRHPDLEGGAVVAREGGSAGKRLVGFFVPRPERAVAVEGLRAWLADKLPDYMVPTSWVRLDRLPLTATGKLDRASLAALEEEPEAREESGGGQRRLTETVLAQIWSEVLGVSAPGADADFFALGGHSLFATQVVSRARRAFEVELPLSELFEAPILSQLAAAIERRRVTGSAFDRLPPISPRVRRNDPPLSFAQERVWFLDQLDPGTPIYNVATALRFRGKLDPAACAAALSEVVRRHEVLRTSYPTIIGRPVQKVAPPLRIALPIVDLGSLPRPERDGRLTALATAAADRPFDLARPPMIRACLVRMAADDHAALVQMHHIASDGWSMSVFARELTLAYEAFAAGAAPALPELPIQYADYAVWQRTWMRGRRLAQEIAHWRERLAGFASAIELPTDRPRPSVRDHAGAATNFLLDRDTAGAFSRLVREHDATLFMGLLAAFQTLLARASGQLRFNLGVPIAGRQRAEVEGLIGFFVNTLVLRSDLDGDPTFAGLLARDRGEMLTAYDHQELPFEKLVEELEPVRTPGLSPLFQVVIALQNLPPASIAADGLKVGDLEISGSTAKFDLSLELVAGGSGIEGTLNYATDLYEGPTIGRWIGHFLTLIESAIRDPEARAFALPLLTAPEREQLERCNDTSIGQPVVPFPRSFEARVDVDGEALALKSGAVSLAYGELDRRANRLARHLIAAGVGPEVRVAVCVERSAEVVVALLAVLKAGGAYLPLDPVYPEERLAFLWADSGARFLITRSQWLERLPEISGVVVCLDRDEAAIAARSPERPAVRIDPDQLAYVIYTSGSTGQAKGVEVAHRGLANLASHAGRWFSVVPASRFFQFFSLSFDASIFEIATALASGATLFLAPPGAFLVGAELHALLARERITHAVLTPSVLTTLPLLPLPDLEVFLVGAEMVSAEVVDRWAPGRAFWNGYGPTEATILSTMLPCTAGTGRPPIGRPIDNVRAHVVDALGQQVPVGIEGELRLAGAGVARGYLGRPDLTAEWFVPDPFGPPGERLYRTGDRVVRRPDGDLAYLGRLDHQVKIRGFRVEPEEIEEVLVRHPRVVEAAVVARPDSGGNLQLIAYAGCPSEEPPTVSELRDFLDQRLPPYMLPAQLVVLSALPLLPSGKVDRSSLPDPAALPRGETGEAYAPPRTPIEQLISEIWAQALEVDRVDRNASFFALGGHSMLAAYVTSRLREMLNLDVEVRTLFEEPTLAGLSRRIEALLGGGDADSRGIVRVSRRRTLPLSFAQQRLWFLDRLAPESTAYDIPLAFRISGSLDRAAFAAAITRSVERHEVLRTRYPAVEGVPEQRIEPPAAVPLPLLDLTGLAGPSREGIAARLTGADAQGRFDLARGPVFRVSLIRLEPREHVFRFELHHIAGDGWSIGVLIRELSASYAAALQGRVPALPELPIQYADYALWQRRQLEAGGLDPLLAFWREELAGMPAALDLPTDRPRAAVREAPAASRSLALSSGLGERLRQVARGQGATLFMVVLAILRTVLARISGQADFALGTPIAGRDRAELEPLVGFFVNTLVLRGRSVAGESLQALLGRVRTTLIAAYAHAALPFEKLVEELQVERNPSQTPLFQVQLSVEENALESPTLPGAALVPIAQAMREVKFDLQAGLTAVAGGETSAAIGYNAALFDPAGIERLLGAWRRLMEVATEGPEMPLDELSWIEPAERFQQLVEWNDTAADALAAVDLPGRIAAEARTRPDAIAVAADGGQLSYAELWRRAGRVARLLARRGVGPEIPVGLCLERGCEMVIGMLGIARAGGAFVPLDPEYPARRLALLVASSGISVVLTVERFAPALAASGADRVLLDAAETLPAVAEGAEIREGWREPLGLAYVIYTSGSTGEPKGCMNSWQGLANRVLWMQQAYPLGPEDRVLQKTPFSFDVSVWEFFWPLAVGARLVMATPGGHRDGAYLAATLCAEGITLVHFVPSMLQVVLEVPAIEECHGLRRILASGEALPFETWQRCRARLGASLHNLYGPTEAAIDVTFWDGPPEIDKRVVPIGRPIANLAVHVLDAELGLVPLGVRGELFLGGVGVGRGYRGRPDLTAERFVPDPFSGTPGGRLYRTGDLCRRLPGGEVEFLGRLDHQLKLRGFRIELGEIEAALQEQPGVVEAAVLGLGSSEVERRLVGFAAAALGVILDPGALAAALGERLPPFMVPQQIVVAPALPRLSSGKIDRRALAALAPPAGGARTARISAPRDSIELQVVQLFEEILSASDLGLDDDFFALGGHSLLGVRLMVRLERLFAQSLPISLLLASSTPRRLAEVLRRAQPVATGPLVALQPRGDAPPLVFVHPIGGDVLCYLPLARHLGTGRPFLALQAPIGPNPEAEEADLESLARRYLGAVRRARPDGPLVLGGWSFGGAVAFAMARLEEAAGMPPPQLILVDAPTPAAAAELNALAEGLGLDDAMRLVLDARQLDLGGGRRIEIDEAALSGFDPEVRVRGVLAQLAAAGAIPAEVGVEAAARHLETLRRRERLLATLAPGTFSGPVLLLRAAERAGIGSDALAGFVPERELAGMRAAEERWLDDPAYGWQASCVRRIDVVEVPGDHHSIVGEPHVTELARRIAAWLGPLDS